MDIDLVWKSLKNEGNGIPFITGECGTSVITERHKPIACRCFDIDAVANELTLNKSKGRGWDDESLDSCSDSTVANELALIKSKGRGWDDEALDSCSDSTCSSVFNEKVLVTHLDSDDEDETGEGDNAPPKEAVATTIWRVERLARALCSDSVLVQIQTLRELKETINVMRMNLPRPGKMKYPPPYDNSMIKLNQNLPLVSDLVKPKLLENTTNAHAVLTGPCLTKNQDVASATTTVQLILNSCGNALFRLIGGSKSEKCRCLAILCVQSLLLAGVDTRRHISFLIPALCARYPPSSYDKDMDVFIQDSQSHDFYKRGGATNRQDRNRVYSQGMLPCCIVAAIHCLFLMTSLTNTQLSSPVKKFVSSYVEHSLVSCVEFYLRVQRVLLISIIPISSSRCSQACWIHFLI